MAKFTVVLQDATGAVQSGLNVDLYLGNGGGAKYGDFTENSDSSYSINVTTSGLYTVKVNGATETELQSIYIATEDIDSRITANANDIVDLQEALSLHIVGGDHDGRYYTKTNIDGKFAALPGDGLIANAGALDLLYNDTTFTTEIGGGVLDLLDDSIKAQHLNEDVVGDGLAQNPSGSLYIPLYSEHLDYWGPGLHIQNDAITLDLMHISAIRPLSRSNLLYGYKDALSASESVEMRTVDGCESNGYTTMFDGHVTRLAVSCNNNIESGNIDISIVIGLSVAVTVNFNTFSGDFAVYNFPVDAYHFSDLEKMRILINSHITSGDISDISIVMEIQKDNDPG